MGTSQSCICVPSKLATITIRLIFTIGSWLYYVRAPKRWRSFSTFPSHDPLFSIKSVASFFKNHQLSAVCHQPSACHAVHRLWPSAHCSDLPTQANPPFKPDDVEPGLDTRLFIYHKDIIGRTIESSKKGGGHSAGPRDSSVCHKAS